MKNLNNVSQFAIIMCLYIVVIKLCSGRAVTNIGRTCSLTPLPDEMMQLNIFILYYLCIASIIVRSRDSNSLFSHLALCIISQYIIDSYKIEEPSGRLVDNLYS